MVLQVQQGSCYQFKRSPYVTGAHKHNSIESSKPVLYQVSRLSALLEASKLQAALNAEQLMADLADERLRAERLRAVRDDALMQRCASCT